jgi:adenylate cyclase, class 2
MAEVEVKAKIKDFRHVEEKLREIGCTLSQPITQNDKVYVRNGVQYENVNRDHTPALRIRREQSHTTLNVKYNRTTEMDMVEHEVTINDPQEMETMLKVMEYYEVLQINKVRRKGTYKNYEICLDEVENLGSFIEVEKITEDEGAKIQEELMTFLVSLGVSQKDRILHGYDTLLLKKKTDR